jgi:tetratricopeptide (TPR) repeat protein
MSNARTISIIIFCLLVSSVRQVYALVAIYPFRERTQRSDLIVEGVFEKQTENPGFDWQDINSFRKKSLLKVTKVYKGDIAEGNKLTIFSHMNFPCDTSRKLTEGGLFLLMLRRHDTGFTDVNHGHGMWEIITLDKDEQFIVGDLQDRTWGQSYKQFKNDLAWALSKPPSKPKQPTISAEQAKNIALEALSKANVDLKGFQLTKQKLTNTAGDMIGIAYKGDPMWLFRWTKPEAEAFNPAPPGTFLSCYVHAHTGKSSIGPKSLREPLSTENSCRLLLKTYRHYRPIYAEHADNIDIIQLTGKEFRKSVLLLEDTFLNTRPVYPEETTFLRVEFPCSIDINPVMFRLNLDGRVEFAGIMPAKKRAIHKPPLSAEQKLMAKTEPLEQEAAKYMEKGQADKAVTIYKELLELIPRHEQYEKALEKATAYMKAAAATTENWYPDAPYIGIKGRCSYYLANIPEDMSMLKEEFELAQFLNGEHFEGWSNIFGKDQKGKDKFVKALKLYEHIVDYYPENEYLVIRSNVAIGGLKLNLYKDIESYVLACIDVFAIPVELVVDSTDNRRNKTLEGANGKTQAQLDFERFYKDHLRKRIIELCSVPHRTTSCVLLDKIIERCAKTDPKIVEMAKAEKAKID